MYTKQSLYLISLKFQRYFVPIVLILVLIFVAEIVAGVYYVRAVKNKPQSKNSQTSFPSVTPYQSSEFSKKLFLKTDQILNTENFPEQMITISDDKLVGLKCSNKKDVTVNEIRALEGLREFETNKTVGNVVYCQTEDNREVLGYELISLEKPYAREIYYGFIHAQLQLVRNPTQIDSDGGNFTCLKPLLLTQADMLAVHCSEMNSEYEAESIYYLDLEDLIPDRVIKCVSDLGKVSCDKSTKSLIKTTIQVVSEGTTNLTELHQKVLTYMKNDDSLGLFKFSIWAKTVPGSRIKDFEQTEDFEKKYGKIRDVKTLTNPQVFDDAQNKDSLADALLEVIRERKTIVYHVRYVKSDGKWYIFAAQEKKN